MKQEKSEIFLEFYRRLGQTIDKHGLTIGGVEDKLGFGRDTLRNAIKKGSALGVDKVFKLLEMFPDEDLNWLFKGITEAKFDNNRKPTAIEVNEPAAHYGKQKPIPLIPFDALASPGRGELGFMENQAESFYIVPEFAKADYLIRVKGSSMFPKFYPGEIIACQRLEAKSFVQWNHPHVLDTTQGLIVKNIMPGKDDEHWIMNSENEDYPDFEIPKSEVYSRSRVLGSIRLY